MPSAASWPSAAHFNMILQNPRIAFRNPELKEIAIEKDAHNQPRPWAGAFASVYKGTHLGNGHALAVRVFTSAVPERRERYQAISEYLRGRRLNCLVDFAYQDDGIRSAGDGKWYPLVTMEWVHGDTLYKWAQSRCLENDRQALAQAADRWVELVQELAAAEIAHGDLQHANVMVTDDGKLKLVDYDCMCVPSLVGRKNLEIGVDPYQHPQRTWETLLSPNLDNFSALFILVALKALAAAPEMWNTYVEQRQYDKLLLHREDLHAPDRSPLVQALLHSPDPNVQRLCRQLVDLSRAQLDQVPRLDQVLFSFDDVARLLDQRDFDAAVELLHRGKKNLENMPAELQPAVREAQERVKVRKSLAKAVRVGDEAAMQRLSLSDWLDGYPKAQVLLPAARQASRVLPLLKQLRAARQAESWREFIEIWDANQELLSKRKSAEAFTTEVLTWRKRNQAWDEVRRLLAQSECDANALAAAWGQLLQIGFHPEAEPLRARIDKLIKRESAWVGFRKVPGVASETCDARLVKVWNEDLFAGWEQAELERPRVVEARRRLETIERLRQVVAEDFSAAGEAAIVAAAAQFPADYAYKLLPRVDQARRRLEAIAQLRQALGEPAYDAAIVRAWQRVAQVEGLSLVTEDERSRIVLAEQRLPLVQMLEEVPASYPVQQAPRFDYQLLAIWNDVLFRDCHDVGPWREAYQAAMRRRPLLEQLKAAVEEFDKRKIADLVADPGLQDYPLPGEWVRPINASLSEYAAVDKLLAALADNKPTKFAKLFDARVIRQHEAAFLPHQDRLRQWVKAEILAGEKIGLGPPLARKALVQEKGAPTNFRVSWTWPDPRFCERCTVVICRDKPRGDDDPESIAAHARLPVDRRGYEDAGGSRLVHIEEQWLGSYVAVWAIVDLGFETFHSSGLILGRLEGPSPRPTRAKPKGILW